MGTEETIAALTRDLLDLKTEFASLKGSKDKVSVEEYAALKKQIEEISAQIKELKTSALPKGPDPAPAPPASHKETKDELESLLEE